MLPKYLIITISLSLLYSCSLGPTARKLNNEETYLLEKSKVNLTVNQAIEIANEYFNSNNNYEVRIVGGFFNLEFGATDNIVLFTDSSFSFLAYKQGDERYDLEKKFREEHNFSTKIYNKDPYMAVYPYTEVSAIYFRTNPLVDVNFSTYTGNGNIVFIVGTVLYKKWDSSITQTKTLYKLLAALKVLMPNIAITTLDENSYKSD